MKVQINPNEKIGVQTISALVRFLNYHLIATNHGLTFESILITLVEQPKNPKKLKHRYLYKKYADIAIPFDFKTTDKLSLVDFKAIFELIIENIDVIAEIEVANKDVQLPLLKTDLIALRTLLPETPAVLSRFIENAEALDELIHLKWMDCRAAQRINNKKPLVKKLKGFRAYDQKENRFLTLYLNKIVKILIANLKGGKVLTPGYTELYFSLSDTLDDTRSAFPLESWYEFTYVVIDYEKFKQSDPFGKFNYLWTIIYDALADIWNVDGLDKAALESLKEHFESDLDNLLTQPDGEITDEMQAFLKEEKIWLETSLQLENLRNASRHVAKS